MPGVSFATNVCWIRTGGKARWNRLVRIARCYRLARSACWVRFTRNAYWNCLPKRALYFAKKTPPGIVQPETPTATVSPAEMTTGNTSPSVPASVDIPPPDTSWLVSETTSPVDFTPLLTAMTRLPSSMKHAPNMLAIRCRGARTELLVRTGGTWRSRAPGKFKSNIRSTTSLPLG